MHAITPAQIGIRLGVATGLVVLYLLAHYTVLLDQTAKHWLANSVWTFASLGAALACIATDGSLALPVMDYTSEPPAAIVAAYREIMPPFSET